MSNVHGLFSGKKKEDDHDDDDDKDTNDDENNRYVGGIGERGGGSGLAVVPNNDGNEQQQRDSLFQLAQNASAEDRNEVRRTITMYRDGFVVDDGPYRRLDDPANAEFLRALAMGRTPRELMEGSDMSKDSNVVVGLVDKRSEEYVEQFRSFSGQGTSLGTAATAASSSEDGAQQQGVFDPATMTSSSTTPAAAAAATTSIQVRLISGQRRVLRLAVTATVADLAMELRDDAAGQPFRLVSGFPPRPLTDPNMTVDEAGLKGAQVSMQKV